MLSPCTLIFRRALVYELQLYSWLTGGMVSNRMSDYRHPRTCEPEQHGLPCLALLSSCVWVHVCAHTQNSYSWDCLLSSQEWGTVPGGCTDAGGHIRTLSQAASLPGPRCLRRCSSSLSHMASITMLEKLRNCGTPAECCALFQSEPWPIYP